MKKNSCQSQQQYEAILQTFFKPQLQIALIETTSKGTVLKVILITSQYNFYKCKEVN